MGSGNLKKENLESMREFLLQGIERSEGIEKKFVEEDVIGVTYNEEGEAAIILPGRSTLKEHQGKTKELRREGYRTANVFYKDGENFFVRLGGSAQHRKNKSLKNYSKEERDKMIHLRQLEKNVSDPLGGLTYYQPQTERLEESLRLYSFKNVFLDYEHPNKGEGYASSGPSQVYKIANLENERSSEFEVRGVGPYSAMLLPKYK